MKGRNGPLVIFVILTTATKIKNRIDASRKRREELYGLNIIVIGLIIEEYFKAIREGIILFSDEVKNKNVKKAILDIKSIIDNPRGWFGVRAVK